MNAFCLYSWLATAALHLHQTSHVIALAVPTSANANIANVRRAVELSKKANADPSFAGEACKLWSSILNYDSEYSGLPLPLGAMPSAHALYASTLARVGRDKEAIVEYEKSLSFLTDGEAMSNPLAKEEFDIRMGMGKSLQRMLRYREAAGAFFDIVARCKNAYGNTPKKSQDWIMCASSDSMRSAALCCVRMGDLDSAISVLTLENLKGQSYANVAGMKGTLLLIQGGPNNREVIQIAEELLRTASEASASPLYHWVFHLISQTNKLDSSATERFWFTRDIYLSFAEANNSAFDDPGLVVLDDKILLHSAVMSSCNDCCFWPQGYILPEEIGSFVADFREDENIKEHGYWILKERCGYGSHGNSIASTDEVISMYDTTKPSDSILCQRIVHPPMLLDGRKFSLRIYVIYFPPGLTIDGALAVDAEIYVSTEGLVKYASAPYVNDSASEHDQLMTNSGRGDGRSSLQHDLRHIQNYLHKNGFKYQILWESIEKSVQFVMKRYIDLQRSETKTKVATSDGIELFKVPSTVHINNYPLCSLPKIMGFDFILNSSANPFLLEVNRFPGLEPRSSMDASIKHSVVFDAWVAACERMKVPRAFLQGLCPPDYKGYALKKLPLA